MSKTVKIVILVIVLAVAAYFTYQWYTKSKAAGQASKPAAKQPLLSGPKVDKGTGLNVVSDISNGLQVDEVLV